MTGPGLILEAQLLKVWAGAFSKITMLVPAVNDGAWLIGMTVVATCAPGAVPLLLEEFGSAVPEVPDTMLVNEPYPGAVTVKRNVVPAPLGNDPNVQWTIPPADAPPGAITNVTLVGSMSMSEILLAVEGPKFVTEMV